MKECNIKIEYPDHFTNNEIVNAIMSQIDIKSLNELGITIYAPKEFSWFN
jgi:hypothetical protein